MIATELALVVGGLLVAAGLLFALLAHVPAYRERQLMRRSTRAGLAVPDDLAAPLMRRQRFEELGAAVALVVSGAVVAVNASAIGMVMLERPAVVSLAVPLIAVTLQRFGAVLGRRLAGPILPAVPVADAESGNVAQLAALAQPWEERWASAWIVIAAVSSIGTLLYGALVLTGDSGVFVATVAVGALIITAIAATLIVARRRMAVRGLSASHTPQADESGIVDESWVWARILDAERLREPLEFAYAATIGAIGMVVIAHVSLTSASTGTAAVMLGVIALVILVAGGRSSLFVPAERYVRDRALEPAA